MLFHETIVVEAAQNVSVGEDEPVADEVAGVAHRAAGAEQFRLAAVFDPDAELVAVTEVRFDHIGMMPDQQHELAKPAGCERIDHMLEKGTPRHSEHRLRQSARERAEPRAEAAGEDDDFHDRGERPSRPQSSDVSSGDEPVTGRDARSLRAGRPLSTARAFHNLLNVHTVLCHRFSVVVPTRSR